MDDLGVTPIVGSQMENDRHEMKWSSKIVGFQQCRKLSQSSMNTDAASAGHLLPWSWDGPGCQCPSWCLRAGRRMGGPRPGLFSFKPACYNVKHTTHNLYICCSFYLSVYLSIYLSVYLSTYLSTYLSIYLSIHLPIYILYLPTYLSTYLPTYLSTYVPISPSIYLSIDLSIYLSNLCVPIYVYE